MVRVRRQLRLRFIQPLLLFGPLLRVPARYRLDKHFRCSIRITLKSHRSVIHCKLRRVPSLPINVITIGTRASG